MTELKMRSWGEEGELKLRRAIIVAKERADLMILRE